MILRKAPAKIGVTVTDADGVEIDPEESAEPAVTVTVVQDSDGETIVEEQAATYVSGGLYTYELSPADLPGVELLRASWEVADDGGTFETVVEVVGGWLCTLEEIQAAFAGAATAKTMAQLTTGRMIAEALLEDECGVAFRPRYARETLEGGVSEVLLGNPRPLRLISVTDADDVALDLDEITLARVGTMKRDTPFPAGDLEVVYEHGWERPPAGAARAAAQLARFAIAERPSNLDDRATSYTTDLATYTLITPGLRGAVTSLPEVNAFISRYGYVQGVG